MIGQPDSIGELNVVLLGPMSTGKTTMLQLSIKQGQIRSIRQLITNNSVGIGLYFKNINVDGKNVRLNLWDTAGQQRFRSFSRDTLKKAHAIIFVFDVSETSSFNQLQKFQEMKDQQCRQDVVLMLIGNKIDLNNREVSEYQGSTFARGIGAIYAQTTFNQPNLFNEALQKLTKKMLEKFQNEIRKIKKQNDKIRLESQARKNARKEEKGGCC